MSEWFSEKNLEKMPKKHGLARWSFDWTCPFSHVTAFCFHFLIPPWWISISKCDSHSTLARSSDARPKMRCTPGHWVYNYPNCHWGFTHWSWFGKKSPSNMDSFGHDTDGSRWLSLAPGVPAPCGQRRQAWRMQIQCVFFYFVNLY